MEQFLMENWLYVAVGAAILVLYQVNGQPLFRWLLDKLKSNPQPVAQPQVAQQPQVTIPPVQQYDKALGVTLLGQEVGELTIKREKV